MTSGGVLRYLPLGEIGAWLRAAACSRVDQAGPGEHTFASIVRRYAVRVHAVIVVSCGAFEVLTLDRDQALTIGPLVCLVSLWCGVLVLRPAATWFAGVDAAILIAVGLSQLVTGPQPVASWAFVLAAIAGGTSHYEWPGNPTVAWSLAGLGVGSFIAGNLLAGPAPDLLDLALRLVVQSLLGWVVFVLIRASARVADATAARVAARRREASVAEARRAAEREYLATLHDTASTTMLMVSTGTDGGDRPWLAERARRDLDALLAAPRVLAGDVDLAAWLSSLAVNSAIHVRTDLHGPLVLPAAAALAIVLGVEEALSNVRQHSDVSTAVLTAERDDGGTLAVELRDDGRGFRPEEVSVHRRGISGSIIERMRSVGGRATVSSAPGMGTTVRWEYSVTRCGA